MSIRHAHGAAKNAARAPSERQRAAGNYRHGHSQVHGIHISIENDRGSIRRGLDDSGKPWFVKMPAIYGYIKRTEGSDGEEIDCYIGPHLNSRKVFVLDQNDAKTGEWDEHKVWFGFNSPQHVLNTYRKAFSDGKADKRFGHLKQMTPDEFTHWLKEGDTTRPIKERADAARNSRNVQDTGISAVGRDAESLSKSERQDVSPLRRSRDQGVRGMVKVRGLSTGGRATPNQGDDDRQDQQRRELRAGERPVGDAAPANAEHESQQSYQSGWGGVGSGGSRSEGWDQSQNPAGEAGKGYGPDVGGDDTSAPKPIASSEVFSRRGESDDTGMGGALGDEATHVEETNPAGLDHPEGNHTSGHEKSAYLAGDDTPVGMVEAGNIDLTQRPEVINDDGSISTVRSLGINVDGKEVLIPTVSDDGRVLSNEDAVNLYLATGKHLGIFDTPEASTAYAHTLHEEQEKMHPRRARGGHVPHMAEGGGLMSDEDMGVQAPVMSDADMGVTAKPDAGALSAAGRGAFQGATFNFGDELSGIRAAAPSWMPEAVGPLPAKTIAGGARVAWDKMTGRDPEATKAYDETVSRERDANKLAAEQHPWAYHGAEVAGAIPATVALPGGMAARGATLANRVRQGATLGAEAGALTGAGEGEDAASRLTGAAVGTAVGGAGGALAAPATEIAGWALKKTLGPAWNALVGTFRGSENEAARRITNAIELDAKDIATGKMEGMTLQQWGAARAAGEPVTLNEMGGTRTQALLRSAANTSPEGRGAAEKVITERFEGQADRVGKDVRNLVNGGANANKTADQLVAEYDVARGPAYKMAFRHPNAQGMWDDDFAQMAGAPAVQSAIKMASVNAKDEAAKLGLKPPANPFAFNKDGTVTLTDPNFTPNLQFWDVVKKNLDGGDRQSQQWAKILRNKLDDAVPEYGSARGIAANYFGETNALEAGRKLPGKKVEPSAVAAIMRRMDPEEKDLFREGYASDWAGRVIERFGDSRDITKAMFNSPADRKMVETIFGPAGVKKLEARMTLEAVMDGARRALGNSTTARQLIEAGLAGGAIGGYMDGDWKGAVAGAGAAAGARKVIATEAMAGARKLIGKVDAKTAARVAELLTSDDPTKLAAGMRIMVSNKRVADGMRALADRMNIGAQSQAPRLNIDTTGWSGAMPVRADQDQPQP